MSKGQRPHDPARSGAHYGRGLLPLAVLAERLDRLSRMIPLPLDLWARVRFTLAPELTGGPDLPERPTPAPMPAPRRTLAPLPPKVRSKARSTASKGRQSTPTARPRSAKRARTVPYRPQAPWQPPDAPEASWSVVSS